jgi:PAS domain-containing protein
MNDFIQRTREDGTIEFVNPRAEEIAAAAIAAIDPADVIVISDEELAARELMVLRKQRDQKIAETDWWANSDLTMTQAQIDYRQALRDITNTYSSYLDVVWPTKPA